MSNAKTQIKIQRTHTLILHGPEPISACIRSLRFFHIFIYLIANIKRKISSFFFGCCSVSVHSVQIDSLIRLIAIEKKEHQTIVSIQNSTIYEIKTKWKIIQIFYFFFLHDFHKRWEKQILLEKHPFWVMLNCEIDLNLNQKKNYYLKCVFHENQKWNENTLRWTNEMKIICIYI